MTNKKLKAAFWKHLGKLVFSCLFSLFLVSAAVSAADTYEFAEVKVGNSDAFMISDSDDEAAQLRASQTGRIIMRLLADPASNPSRIDVQTLPGGRQAIALDNTIILKVSDQDCKIFGRQQSELASDWAAVLRAKMTQLKPFYAKHGKQQHKGTNSLAKPLADEKVMLFLIQVSLLLISAIACGEVMARFGQPAVTGQLLAGILLGPSVLGALFPGFYEAVFPVEQTQQYLIDIVSTLGMILLLMLTGTETDLALIKAQGKVAAVTSFFGTALPLLAGFLVSYTLPLELLVLPNQRLVLGAFLGTIFSVSSVTVIAKILMDMKLLRRNIGQAILGSSLLQDLGGCLLLSVVAALAAGASDSTSALGGAATASGGNSFAWLKLPLGLILFSLFSATLGRKLVLSSFRWVNDRFRVDYANISLVIVFLLLSSALTSYIGLHVILGAFVIGVLLAQSPLVGEKILQPLEAVTMGIFAPVFFAAAGLHVNLTLLKDPKLLAIAIAVTLIACISKVLGSFLGGMVLKLNPYESLSIGFGTNARGAMGLIVGILGFSLGILTVDLFTVLVLMSIVSTAIAPVFLHYFLPKIPESKDEVERLEREEKQAKSFSAKIKRLLLPVKKGSRKQLSSKLVAALGKHHAIEATALTIYPAGIDTEQFLSETLAASSKEGDVLMVNRGLQSEDPAKAILEEAVHDYDLIVLESDHAPGKSSVFGPVIDEVAKLAPCPLLIVRESEKKADWDLKTILVPTTGRWQTGKAAELALLLAQHAGAKVISLYVVEESKISFKTIKEDEEQRALEALDIVEQVSALSSAYNVSADTMVRTSTNPAEEILQVASQRNVDLIVLGVGVRPTRRLYLGNTVRQISQKAPCHVAILSP